MQNSISNSTEYSNFEFWLNSKSLSNEYFSTTAALFNLCDVLLYHVLVGTRRNRVKGESYVNSIYSYVNPLSSMSQENPTLTLNVFHSPKLTNFFDTI